MRNKVLLIMSLLCINVSYGVNPRLKSNIDYTFSKYDQSSLVISPYAHNIIDNNRAKAKKNYLDVGFLSKIVPALNISSAIHIKKLCGDSLISFVSYYWLVNVDTLIHELGHAAMAKALGYKICEIQLNRYPLIPSREMGAAKTSHQSLENKPHHDFLIAAAGPCASLLFDSSLLYLAYISYNNPHVDYLIPLSAGAVSLLNLVMYSLIPNGKKNDGQQILDAWRALKKS